MTDLKLALVGRGGGALLTGVMRTLRWTVECPEYYDRSRTAVYVLWHGRLVPCSYYHHHHDLATLISQHRDGDYIARVVQGWGYHVVRGSSSRGGDAALRQMVRLLRRGTSIAITPDGPRGPRQKMKLGPLLAARLAGVPLVPVSAGGGAWWVGGWDRFMIPKPFSRIHLRYGPPLHVPRDADEEELVRLAAELEGRLNALTTHVDFAAHGRGA